MRMVFLLDQEASLLLQRCVPIGKDHLGEFVAIASIPQPYNKELLQLIQREMVPVFRHHSAGDCIYPWDWYAWLEGALFCPF
ncbi:hypothetical protein [Cupriavidus pauculus]|uniref:hypothetical protein n=1 Tax=Cupriavidus pauculus TaxID=82633 RepID=UPI001CBD7A73|nr:hypothetical protein [Cupriavidus pauculus]